MTPTTWSGSRVAFSWRIVPRWLRGWITGGWTPLGFRLRAIARRELSREGMPPSSRPLSIERGMPRGRGRSS